jgi:hypothetical protein
MTGEECPGEVVITTSPLPQGVGSQLGPMRDRREQIFLVSITPGPG